MFALSTDYNGESRNTNTIRRTLSAVAGAGFSHVHWCHEWKGPYLYSPWEMRQIREWLDELGLKAWGAHGSCGEIESGHGTEKDFEGKRENLKDYVSPNEYNRLAGVELIKNRIDLAEELGTAFVALHLPLPYRIFEHDRSFKEKFYAAACKSFDELQDYCRERGARICIENLPDSPERFQTEMFDRLFARYDGSFMGLCFDTGHGNITSRDCLYFARRYTDRLFIAHIHDNHGATDEHLIPFEGTFNWEGFAELTAQSPCKLPYLFEIRMQERDETNFFQKVLGAGKQFHALTERFRG
ncbi:MAG: sugar phosphate isomerase/epimerase [Treponema sp.]|jgi:sugar phosphate isomerase/epimerase|nr:sugar phosphate isomerase/epimerase [Treponema sp.]